MKTKRSYLKTCWLLATFLSVNHFIVTGVGQTRPQPSKLEHPGLKLKVAMHQTNFVVGEPIKLTLIVTNTGDQPHWFMKSSSFKDYQFSLIDAAGASVPQKTNEIHRGNIVEVTQWNPPTAKVVVEPGKEDRIETDLNFIFDLKSPGKYQITTTRKVPDLNSLTTSNSQPVFTNLVSNEIEFLLSAPQMK